MNYKDGADQDAQPLELMSMKQLFELPQEEVEFLVDQRLIKGGLSIFAAKPKVGKSTLCRQLIVAVAHGTDFLSSAVEQGEVVYLALEEKLSEVQAHLKLLGATENDPIHIHTGNIDRKKALGRLESTLKANRNIALVVIDPVFKFVNGVRDADDYMQVNSALDPLLQLARDYNVHILTVHHMKKQISEDVMDGLLGSTAIMGTVDAAIAISRRPDGIRCIATRHRYGTELPETQLVWDSDQRKVSLGITADQSLAEEAQNTERRIGEEIMGYVGAHNGVTHEEVMAAVVGKSTTKKRVFNSLSKQFFERSGSGTKGHPYVYRPKSGHLSASEAESNVSRSDTPTLPN
jgi:hypothetical protein